MIFAKIRQFTIQQFIRFLSYRKIERHLAQWQTKQSQKITIKANSPSPYHLDSISDTNDELTCKRDDIIFISSRFRSGSTVMWNMFRQLANCTAYYEPFNERKWFNKSSRGKNVDSTHLGVKDYWREFNDMEDLEALYDQSWIDTNLHMDAASWAPQMKQYICELVRRAEGRPVLQFNRVDFRLPWLKHNFPNAKFIHLYRNPRDQWISFLTDLELMNKNDVASTYQDAFYLNSWCSDLSHLFPFLDEKVTPHPYQRFYYLWKLSYLYGLEYADLSISLEELTQNKSEVAERIISCLNLDGNSNDLTKVIEVPKLEKWKNYADELWFEQFEKNCEINLNIFLSATNDESS
jgi:hypothetical protein